MPRRRERRDPRTREARAELAELEAIVDRIDFARLVTRPGRLEQSEALHLVDHAEAAEFVHGELREALVVRGRERVHEARGATARRRVEQVLREVVRRADEAARSAASRRARDSAARPTVTTFISDAVG